MVENKPTPRKPRAPRAPRTPKPPADVTPPPIEDPAESVAEDIAADETAAPVEGGVDAVVADETAEPTVELEPEPAAGVDATVAAENDTEPVVVGTAVEIAETEGLNATEPIVVGTAAEVVGPDAVNDTLPIVVTTPAEPLAENPEALKARLAALEAENASLRASTATAPAPRRRKPGRTTAAIILILLGALLAPIAVVGNWARDLVVNTDDYVDTIAPIASDPGVQAAVTNRVTTAVVNALNLDQLTTQIGDALGTLDLPPIVSTGITSLKGPLQDAVTGFVRKQVNKIVTSDAFAATWTQANRTAHEQIVATLRGDPDALAQISDSGQLVVDITPIIEQVKTSLVDAGFTLAGRIPTITVTFPIASSADLVRLQNAYRAIDVIGAVLPWISLLLLAAGVLFAQRRSRALVIAGLSLAVAMALLAVGLAIGRWFYTNSLPPTVQRPDVAVTIYDQVVSLLRIELRVGLVLGLIVAIVAFFAGGTPAARSVRETSGQGVAWVRGLGDRHGVGTGSFGVWLYEQRTLIRVVVIGIAVLVLVLADNLTGKVVATVAIVALLVLGVITLLARPAHVEEVTEPLVTS